MIREVPVAAFSTPTLCQGTGVIYLFVCVRAQPTHSSLGAKGACSRIWDTTHKTLMLFLSIPPKTTFLRQEAKR